MYGKIHFVEVLWNELEREARETQEKAYAEGTLQNFRIQWALYFNFCMFFKKTALPAQIQTLVVYIQFLSKKLKALGSIKSYVAGVKTLHELLDLDMSAFIALKIKLMWMGLGNIIEHVPKRAAPMTPIILGSIHDVLDLQKPDNMAFWALCITAFFILARKSNLVPVKTFDPKKQLSRRHLKFYKDYVEVVVHWTKTRRPNQDPLEYPLYIIPGSKICPFKALKNMVKAIPAHENSACFMWENGKAITYSQFTSKLRKCLELVGLDKKSFSLHSFRSGGASWAHRSGVPPEFIKLLGGWKSDVYHQYLEFGKESRKAAGALMHRKIKQLGI